MKKENQKIKKIKKNRNQKKKRNKIRYTNLPLHIVMQQPKSTRDRFKHSPFAYSENSPLACSENSPLAYSENSPFACSATQNFN